MSTHRSQAGAAEQPLTDSDALLVERTLAGDLHAFDALVVKYRRRIERLIGRMVRDAALVEDIAQETFLRAYRALHQFRGDAQFYTWLYRIAVNTAKRTLLALRREPTALAAPVLGDDADDETFRPAMEPSTEESPESVLAAKEIGQAVSDALASLPPDLRVALSLREMDGMSYEDIAAAMQCPIGTVRSRIFRAREAVSARIRPLLEHQSGKRW